MVDRHVPLAAAGLVIAREHSDPFQHSGFSGAVFADDNGDRPVKTQLEIVAQQRQAKRIGRAVDDARWLQPDPLEVRRRQIDRAIAL